MTTPPRHAASGDMTPMRLTISAMMRDRNLELCGRVRVEMTYDPADPHALHLRITDPARPHEANEWVGSREVFAVAALWGQVPPGLDLTVTPIVLTRAYPGQPPRDVPCLRVTLRDTEGSADGMTHRFTGMDVHLDITRSDVLQWLTTTTEVVRIGEEHRHIDMDRTIARLLNYNPRSGS